MGEGEEGSPELLHGPAVLAEAVAGGQVQHPDAYDGEDHQAGDPDVACGVVLLDAGDDQAAEHRDEGYQQRGQKLRRWRVWIRVAQRHDAEDRSEKDKSQERVGEEPEGLAGEVADRSVSRSVELFEHDLS